MSRYVISSTNSQLPRSCLYLRIVSEYTNYVLTNYMFTYLLIRSRIMTVASQNYMWVPQKELICVSQIFL